MKGDQKKQRNVLCIFLLSFILLSLPLTECGATSTSNLPSGYAFSEIQGNGPAGRMSFGGWAPSYEYVEPVRLIWKDSSYRYSLKYNGNYFNAAYGANNVPVIWFGNPEIKKIPWTYGTQHLLIGRNTLKGYTFISDDKYPLMLKVVKEKGYVYLSGSGTVTTPKGKKLRFGKEDSIVKWISEVAAKDQLKREAAVLALGWLQEQLKINKRHYQSL